MRPSRLAGIIGSGVPCALDIFSGPSAIAAWGTFAWTSSAIGASAITINDGSASDLSIGAGGLLSGLLTGQRVAKMFAQVGSSTAEQSTLASRPTIWTSSGFSLPVVRFHAALGTVGSKLLTVVSPPAARSARDITHIWVQRGDAQTFASGGDDKFQRMRVFNEFTGPGSLLSLCASVNVSTGNWNGYTRTFNGSGGWIDSKKPFIPTQGISIHALRLSASGADHFVDGVKYAAGGTITTSNAQPLNIGAGGAAFSLYSDCVDYMGSAFFPAISDNQVNELSGLLRRYLLGVQTATTLWFFDGDSITAGYVSSSNKDMREQSWPQSLLMSLSAAIRGKISACNMAVAAAHLETTASTEHKLITNQGDKINVHIGSGSGYTKRVVVISAGTNDIFYGVADAASVMTKLQTYKTAAETAGATRVLVATQIPRQGFTGDQEIIRTDLNSSILSTFGADAVDVAAQNWQPGGGLDWTTNYQDGIHPNAAGRTLFVAAFSSVLAAEIA